MRVDERLEGKPESGGPPMRRPLELALRLLLALTTVLLVVVAGLVAPAVAAALPTGSGTGPAAVESPTIPADEVAGAVAPRAAPSAALACDDSRVLARGVGSGVFSGSFTCSYATSATTRGGAGPVRQGQAGVNRTVAEIEDAGGTVLGREVTVEAGGVRTRPDLFVETPCGVRCFVEVKTGPTAGLTPNQTTAFPEIISSGGVPRGANAAAAGLPPGQPIGPTPVWVVHQPWPLP